MPSTKIFRSTTQFLETGTYLIIGRESRFIDLESNSYKTSETYHPEKVGFLKPDGDAFVREVAFGFRDGDFLEMEN